MNWRGGIRRGFEYDAEGVEGTEYPKLTPQDMDDMREELDDMLNKWKDKGI